MPKDKAFYKNSSLWGWTVLITLISISLFIPVLTNYDPDKQNLMLSLAPMSWEHLLGTDQYGRDILTRIAYATQLSFLLALFTTISALIPGVFLGILSAYKGGIIDKFFVLLGDMILALPGLLLVLLFISIAPGDFLFLYLGLSLSLWIEFFRVSRTKTKSILVEPYIEASKSLGFGFLYILKKLILPKLMPMILTISTFAMSTAIIAISTLSAIGVGLKPPTSELGSMIVELMPYYDEVPMLVILPSFVIFLFVLALQLISKRSI
ncbi:MAG: ABC transporter permease [Arcobacter sp.]|nr:MAG: ABC transporter permease [Arcobacter sp.]